MESPLLMEKFMEGFVEFTKLAGVTDPEQVKHLLIQAHRLKIAQSNPEQFKDGYDGVMKQAAGGPRGGGRPNASAAANEQRILAEKMMAGRAASPESTTMPTGAEAGAFGATTGAGRSGWYERFKNAIRGERPAGAGAGAAHAAPAAVAVAAAPHPSALRGAANWAGGEAKSIYRMGKYGLPLAGLGLFGPGAYEWLMRKGPYANTSWGRQYRMRSAQEEQDDMQEARQTAFMRMSPEEQRKYMLQQALGDTQAASAFRTYQEAYGPKNQPSPSYNQGFNVSWGGSSVPGAGSLGGQNYYR